MRSKRTDIKTGSYYISIHFFPPRWNDGVFIWGYKNEDGARFVGLGPLFLVVWFKYEPLRQPQEYKPLTSEKAKMLDEAGLTED